MYTPLLIGRHGPRDMSRFFRFNRRLGTVALRLRQCSRGVELASNIVTEPAAQMAFENHLSSLKRVEAALLSAIADHPTYSPRRRIDMAGTLLRIRMRLGTEPAAAFVDELETALDASVRELLRMDGVADELGQRIFKILKEMLSLSAHVSVQR